MMISYYSKQDAVGLNMKPRTSHPDSESPLIGQTGTTIFLRQFKLGKKKTVFRAYNKPANEKTDFTGV